MESGTKLGYYEVISLLGKGGMGEVWRARDTKLGRKVAIKTLPEEFAKQIELRRHNNRQSLGIKGFFGSSGGPALTTFPSFYTANFKPSHLPTAHHLGLLN